MVAMELGISLGPSPSINPLEWVVQCVGVY